MHMLNVHFLILAICLSEKHNLKKKIHFSDTKDTERTNLDTLGTNVVYWVLSGGDSSKNKNNWVHCLSLSNIYSIFILF